MRLVDLGADVHAVTEVEIGSSFSAAGLVRTVERDVLLPALRIGPAVYFALLAGCAVLLALALWTLLPTGVFQRPGTPSTSTGRSGSAARN